MGNIDLKDKRILYELDKNGRATYQHIAKNVGLTKASVLQRVRKLEKEEIILGFTTIVNTMRLGYTTFDYYFKFRNTTAKKEEEIINFLKSQPEVWFVVSSTGYFDLAVLISTKDVVKFKERWWKIYPTIKKYLTQVRVAVLVEYNHHTRRYLVQEVKEKNKETRWGITYPVEVDDIDEIILKILSKNSRTSIINIAKEVNLTPGAVIRRIRILESKKVILGYSINLNTHKLGIKKYKVLVSLVDYSKKKQIDSWLKLHENVIFYSSFIGGEDIEFSVEMEEKPSFLEFINEFKDLFGNSIESINWAQIIRKHTVTYLPK